MRIRSIKPDFFKDEKIAELPDKARLLFIGLWCMADKSGRLELRPKWFKAELFPYEPAIDIDNLLLTVKELLLIRYYQTPDKRMFLWIPNFLKHQRPHSTERASQLPEFKEEYEINSYLTVKKPLDNHMIMDQIQIHGSDSDSGRVRKAEESSHARPCEKEAKAIKKKDVDIFEDMVFLKQHNFNPYQFFNRYRKKHDEATVIAVIRDLNNKAVSPNESQKSLWATGVNLLLRPNLTDEERLRQEKRNMELAASRRVRDMI